MRKFIINSAELIDCTNEDENGNILLSSISVVVEFTIGKKTFRVDFQTTETFDNNAISSNLASSAMTEEDHSIFIDFIGDDDKSEALLKLIKKSLMHKKYGMTMYMRISLSMKIISMELMRTVK